MTTIRVAKNNVINEKSTAVYTATILDEVGAVIPLAQINTMKLTLYSAKSKNIINNRNDQNVLNANGVIIHATTGLLTWTMSPLDTIIEDDSVSLEARIARFSWTYNVDKNGSYERLFYIRNLALMS